jgi:phage gp46-like protein
VGDITVQWVPQAAGGDWVFLDGQIEIGSDLQSAVVVSLFTDALATPDFTPNDGSADRRGWWGDSYGDPGDGHIGSNLWQLARSKKTQAVLGKAKSYCEQALAWLIADGVAASVAVVTEWQNGIRLAIRVTIAEPNGTVSTFGFGWVWAQQGA